MKLNRSWTVSRTSAKVISCTIPNSWRSSCRRESVNVSSPRTKKDSSILLPVLWSARILSVRNTGTSTWSPKRWPRVPVPLPSTPSSTIPPSWLSLRSSRWPSVNAPIITIGKEPSRSPPVWSMLIYWLISSLPLWIPSSPCQTSWSISFIISDLFILKYNYNLILIN